MCIFFSDIRCGWASQNKTHITPSHLPSISTSIQIQSAKKRRRKLGKEMPKNIQILPRNNIRTSKSRTCRTPPPTVPPRSFSNRPNRLRQPRNRGLRIPLPGLLSIRRRNFGLESAAGGDHTDSRHSRTNQLFLGGKRRAPANSVRLGRQQIAEKTGSVQGSRDVLASVLERQKSGQQTGGEPRRQESRRVLEEGPSDCEAVHGRQRSGAAVCRAAESLHLLLREGERSGERADFESGHRQDQGGVAESGTV